MTRTALITGAAALAIGLAAGATLAQQAPPQVHTADFVAPPHPTNSTKTHAITAARVMRDAISTARTPMRKVARSGRCVRGASLCVRGHQWSRSPAQLAQNFEARRAMSGASSTGVSRRFFSLRIANPEGVSMTFVAKARADPSR